MIRNLKSWFVGKLEREFPVRKPKRTTLIDRVKPLLAAIAGCILGLLLVVFVITAIDGRLDLFWFLAGLIVAGILALVVAIILVVLAMTVARNWSRGIRANPFKAEASDSLRLDCAGEEAASRCLAALRQLPQGCDLRAEDAAPGEILAKTHLSDKSAGEIISINLAAFGDHATEVAIRSRSWFDTTLFDWGVNGENVETIRRYLMRAAPCGAASD